MRSGLTIAELRGHSGSQKAIRWCPKKSYLLCTSSRDGSIRVWDVRQRTNVELGSCFYLSAAHTTPNSATSSIPVTDVVFSGDSTIFSGSCRNSYDRSYDITPQKLTIYIESSRVGIFAKLNATATEGRNAKSSHRSSHVK